MFATRCNRHKEITQNKSNHSRNYSNFKGSLTFIPNYNYFYSEKNTFYLELKTEHEKIALKRCREKKCCNDGNAMGKTILISFLFQNQYQ